MVKRSVIIKNTIHDLVVSLINKPYNIKQINIRRYKFQYFRHKPENRLFIQKHRIIKVGSDYGIQ